MFPWKKAKDKDEKSKRRDDKKGSSSGSDGRRRHLVISGPIPTRAGGVLVSPLPEEEDSPAPNAGPVSAEFKKPPPVPPKKPAVARTLSVPKSRPPDRPTPRSSSLMAQPLASVFKQAVRNGHAAEAQAPAGQAVAVPAGLVLPPIRTALRCPQPRILTVQRQPSGDFGFSLRRSALSDGLAGDDRRRTLMFAEPSTLGSGGGTGLLPGDRLLEVNGVSVDERTREDVVEMVRSSGDCVVLKVQPLPELCEIVARVAGGGPTNAGTQGRHRTLSRTGSRRHRTLGVSGRGASPLVLECPLKTDAHCGVGMHHGAFVCSQAKTDEEIAEERQWLQSEKVWVLFEGGYAGACLVGGDQAPPREGKVRVRLDATGELLDVDQEDVDKVSPPVPGQQSAPRGHNILEVKRGGSRTGFCICQTPSV